MVSVPPRLLVFDLDGTLIDSSLDLCNSVNAALAHVGKPSLPNALIASYIGDGAAMLVRRALGDPHDLDALHPDRRRRPLPPHLRLLPHLLPRPQARQHPLLRRRPRSPHAKSARATRICPWPSSPTSPLSPRATSAAPSASTPFFFQNYGGNSFTPRSPTPKASHPHRRSLRSHRLAHPPATHRHDRRLRRRRPHRPQRGGARFLGCTFGLAPAALAAAQPELTVDNPSEWPAALGLT